MSGNKSGDTRRKKTNSLKGGADIVIKVLRWAYHSIMTIITIGILLVYLASSYSENFDPRDAHYISFLGIGYHLILISAIIWLAIILFLRHWKLSAILGLSLLLTYNHICRYFPVNFMTIDPVTSVIDDDGNKKEIDVCKIKVLTYNTCGLGQVHLSKIKEKIPILDVIRSCDADIVCLQEYAFTLSKGGHTQEQIRQSLSDLYPYYDFMPNSGRTALGIAVFSKFPIKNMVRIDKSKKDYVASMFYELNVKGQRVVLLNNHLHSNLIKQRDRILYDEMIEHFEADSLQRIRTGMLRSLGSGLRARASEAHKIRDFIKERIGDEDVPIVICGDMNDTPISYCYKTMRGELEDAWQNAGFGSGTTYNQHHFWFRIDHIFHSSHFKTLDTKVLKQYEYSDHYPLLTTLQLLKCN